MLLPHLCDIDPKITYQDKDGDILVVDGIYKEYEARNIIQKIDKLNLIQIREHKFRTLERCKKLSDLIITILSDKVYIKDWSLSSVSEEWRITKGEAGYYTPQHFDECVITNINEKSFYSILIYLTDEKRGVLQFPELNLSFEPKPGRMIVFKQSLIHLSPPCENDKYFLHNEVYFTRYYPIENPKDILDCKRYLWAKTIPDPEERSQIIEKILKENETLEEMVLNLCD